LGHLSFIVISSSYVSTMKCEQFNLALWVCGSNLIESLHVLSLVYYVWAVQHDYITIDVIPMVDLWLRNDELPIIDTCYALVLFAYVIGFNDSLLTEMTETMTQLFWCMWMDISLNSSLLCSLWRGYLCHMVYENTKCR
jgi:hypothetical protein